MTNINDLFKKYCNDLTPSKKQEDKMFVKIFGRMPEGKIGLLQTLMQINFLRFNLTVIICLAFFIPLAIVVNRNGNIQKDVATESVMMEDENLKFQNKSGEESRDIVDDYMMFPSENMEPSTASDINEEATTSESSTGTSAGNGSTTQAPVAPDTIIPRTGISDNTILDEIAENDSVVSEVFNEDSKLIATISEPGKSESLRSYDEGSDDLNLLKFLLILFFFRV